MNLQIMVLIALVSFTSWVGLRLYLQVYFASPRGLMDDLLQRWPMDIIIVAAIWVALLFVWVGFGIASIVTFVGGL